MIIPNVKQHPRNYKLMNTIHMLDNNQNWLAKGDIILTCPLKNAHLHVALAILTNLTFSLALSNYLSRWLVIERIWIQNKTNQVLHLFLFWQTNRMNDRASPLHGRPYHYPLMVVFKIIAKLYLIQFQICWTHTQVYIPTHTIVYSSVLYHFHAFDVK